MHFPNMLAGNQINNKNEKKNILFPQWNILYIEKASEENGKRSKDEWSESLREQYKSTKEN